MDHVRDPGEIYARSFAMIRAETDLSALPAPLEPVAVRLIHACGMSDLVADLRFDAGIVAAARNALAAGAPILVDTEMTAASIIRARLPARNEVVCTLNDPSVAEMAAAQGSTRSAAAICLWRTRLGGALVAIGNAPTALFALLDLLDAGTPKPAAILAFPVGFVGAAESKAALAEDPRGVPFLSLLGRRGGSALAGAAVNALGAGAAE